jgi:hypothetical protein
MTSAPARRANGAKPSPTAGQSKAAGRRNEIPLGADFKDF